MQTFDPVRSRLEEMVEAGEFSVKKLVNETARAQVLCVITIPYEKQQADSLKLLRAVSGAVRKTDYVRCAFGAVQVIGWTSREGAYRLLGKVRRVAKGKELYCTTLEKGAELLKESQVARIAIGLEQPGSAPYLSEKLLSQEEIRQYAGLVRAIHPNVLEKLRVIIARSYDFYDRLDWTRTPRGEGFVAHKGAAHEGELKYFDRPGEFVVGLEHPGESVRYDEKKSMLVREEKGYKVP
ncbi:hypothetical protein C4580_01130 [Candidatus Woesearchaeota archaeon]|nr:MAG: hypothetical protein C4580_01130 [Candidatus Woesearchaeota archaeon]